MSERNDRAGDAYAAGRAAWPGLDVERAVFLAHVGSLAEAPALERAGDVYLACACAAGVAGAAAAFQATFAADIARAARKVATAPGFVEEVTQVVLVRLLVADGSEPPRIARYEGRGPLRHWIAVATVRRAINLRTLRAEGPHDSLASGIGAALPPSPEQGILRERHKADLEDALRRALAALPDRERALLRLHLVDRLTIDGIASTYQIGRSTAARWLAAARDRIFHVACDRFCEVTGVTPAEFASIAGALQSQLDVSLATQLAAGH